MKSTLSKILLVPMLLAFTAHAGTVTGMIRAVGKPGTDDSPTRDGAYGSHKFKFVERVDYAEMHDFVVYIEGPVEKKTVVPEMPATVESHSARSASRSMLPCASLGISVTCMPAMVVLAGIVPCAELGIRMRLRSVSPRDW